jgi:phosphoribosylglycinamide formyltransferase 1
MSKAINLCCFGSGAGSTFNAVATHLLAHPEENINVTLAIASKPDIGFIDHAIRHGIKVEIVDPKKFKDKLEYGNALLKLLDEYKIDLVAQCGHLPLTPLNVINKYSGFIINQHPGAIDPGREAHFGGKKMYGARVMATALCYSLVTGSPFSTESSVHHVSEHYDQGKLVRVSLFTEDFEFCKDLHEATIETLKAHSDLIIEETKRLQKLFFPTEHMNVIKAILMFSNGKSPKGYLREKPLIPEEMISTLEECKQLAVELFPKG